MARPIDEKIVAMKMDITDFKRKALETTSLFGRLKDNLSKVGETKGFTKIRDGLASIQSSARKVDMSVLASAVDNVTGRFSSLDVMATTALATITNKAVNAGLALSKSLGIDQITSGFSEYELKIGSIGTVLSNTEWNGTGLKDVNKALAELNEYSDQTIYNFAQMSQNVGRFTAAGVTLDDSTTAIKGLGNLAAISGSTTDQMNTAMYQMSQAMASGKLNLMDWNSMTNSGMGGKKTQDSLLATAKAMGIAVDTSDGFRNSIEQGWLTSEVFLQTLKQFGEDESMTEAATKVRTFSQMMDTMKEGIGSGWAESWEIIFGDFEEATKLWTGLSDFFGGFFKIQAKSRNALLRGIFDNGALGNIFEGLGNMAKPIIQVFKAIGAGFKMAFPPMGASAIRSIFEMFRILTGGMKLSGATVENIKTIFAGFFSVFAIGWKIIKGAFSIILALIPSFDGLGAVILELIAKIARIPLAFNKATDSGDAFQTVLKVLKTIAMVIAGALALVVMGVIAFVDAVASAWNILVKGDFKGGPWEEDSYIVDKLFDIREAIVETVGMIVSAWNILVNGDFRGGPWEEDSSIVDKLFNIREAIVDVVGAITTAWNALVKGDFKGGPWEEDSAMVDSLFDIRESVVASVKAIKDAWTDLFSGKADSKKDDNKIIIAFDKIATATKKVVKALGDVRISLDPITEGFSNFFGALKKGYNWVVDKLSGMGESIKKSLPTGNDLFAGGFIAGLIAIVGISMKIAYDLFQVFKGWGDIGGGIADLLDGVGGALESFAFQVKAQAILTIAIAVAILAGAFWLLSELRRGAIVKGIYAIVGGIGALVAAMALMDKYSIVGGGLSAVTQIIALSIAFAILAGAMKNMAGMEWNEIAKGVVGLAGVMLAFAGAVAVMSKFGGAKIGASALQFIGLAIAINILFSAVKKFGEVDTDILVQGLKALGIILLSLGAFLAIAGKSKFGASSALGIIGISAAIMLIVDSIEDLGEMNVDVLKQGLKTISAILLAIAIFAFVTGVTGLLSASVGLVLLAGALILLMIPITALGLMDLRTLGVGLAAIAIALLAIGGASILMTGMIAAGAGLILLAFGLNLLILPILALGKMSWHEISKGVFGLALAIVVVGGTAALLGLVSPYILAFAVAVVVMGVAMLTAGLGMSLFAGGLVTLAGMTAAAITTIVATLGTLIMGLFSLIPMAVEFVWTIITKMVDALILHGPPLFDKITDLALTMIDRLTEKLPMFIEKGTELIMKIQEGLGLAIPALIESTMVFMLQLIDGLSASIEENGPKIVDSFMGLMQQILLLMIETGTQMVIALFGWIPGVKSAATKIGETGEKYIRENFKAGDAGADKGEEFSTGLNSKKGAAQTAGTEVGKAGDKGAGSVDFKPTGGTAIEGLIGGMLAKKGATENTAESVMKGGKTGAGSVDFKPTGEASIEEIMSGMNWKKSAVNTTGKEIAKSGKSGAASIDMESTGKNFGLGFSGGMSGAIDSVVTAGKNLASRARSSVTKWLEMKSPSKKMEREGDNFGEGFAIGIANKVKSVGASAKGLAMTARDSVNEFIQGFEIPEEDNELHFKAVIDYNTFDPNGFGKLGVMRPDTSFTNSLVAATKAEQRRNNAPQQAPVYKEASKSEEPNKKQPAVIQVVTPDKREMARWLVEDITDFQDFKMATLSKF